MEENQKFEQWAMVEIFGHQKYAGKVTPQMVGQSSFVRIDVPAVDNSQGYTKLFGEKAIYCITPVAEDVVMRYLKNCHAEPVNVYELRDARAPGVSVQECNEDDDNEDLPY